MSEIKQKLGIFFEDIVRKLSPKDLLWIVFFIGIYYIGLKHGPVTSDEAVYWLVRRVFGLILFFPWDALLHGIPEAVHNLSSQLMIGAQTPGFWAKPLLFFILIPLTIVSFGWWTMILPAVVSFSAYFAYGVRKLRLSVLIFVWVVVIATSPLFWLFGPSVTGNVLAGLSISFAIICYLSKRISDQWRWVILGALCAAAILFHYSATPIVFILLLCIFFMDRDRIKKRDLFVLGTSLALPIFFAGFSTLLIQGFKGLAGSLAGNNIFYNYFTELSHQFLWVAGSTNLNVQYYARIFSLTEVGYMPVLLVILIMLFVPGVRKVQRSFVISASVFVLGLACISFVPTKAARTLITILPIGYLGLLYFLISIQDNWSGFTRRTQMGISIIAISLTVALGLMRWPMLTDIFFNGGAIASFRKHAIRQFANPEGYIHVEGRFWPNFCYMNLSGPKPAAGIDCRYKIDVFVFEIYADSRREEFERQCLQEKNGRIFQDDWSNYSVYEWLADPKFGQKVSRPFLYCLIPRK